MTNNPGNRSIQPPSPEKSGACADASPNPAGRPTYPALLPAVTVLFIVALLLRLYAATDNFWLDEIFTYFVAVGQVRSPAEVFTAIRVEHQPLVTLTMHLTQDQPNWLWYRLPSVIAGAGTIALMALAGYRRMGSAALIVTLSVAALSYPLIVYSSEARGYAPAALFSLAMLLLIEGYHRGGRQMLLVGFWLAAAAAVLYHPAAVCIYLSLGLWTLVRQWRSGGGPARMIRELARCHAVPLAFLAWFYFGVMRTWGSVGGDILPFSRVIGDTAAALLGFPLRAEFHWGALLLGGVLLVASLLILARRIRSDRWLFYLSALLLTPALMLWASGRPYLYVRYFVIFFPFFYLLLGEAIDAAARESKTARAAAIGLCCLMLAGNALATADFLRVGRGGPLDAVRYMATQTPRPKVVVGSDHDFRNGLTLLFYGRYLPRNREIVYLPAAAWPPEGPDWFLLHNTCSEPLVPPPAIRVNGRPYRLARSYPVLGLSGIGWHLYRNEASF